MMNLVVHKAFPALLINYTILNQFWGFQCIIFMQLIYINLSHFARSLGIFGMFLKSTQVIALILLQ